jgi:hypothetical protein
VAKKGEGHRSDVNGSSDAHALRNLVKGGVKQKIQANRDVSFQNVDFPAERRLRLVSTAKRTRAKVDPHEGGKLSWGHFEVCQLIAANFGTTRLPLDVGDSR